ncbi:hypothetical protein SGLAM104S_07042 [Streptomyces glaucescens]
MTGEHGESHTVTVPKGYRVGPWEVREPLASGAFATVYAAHNAAVGTAYATKQLQKAWGLTQDGKVGTKTFGSADEKWNPTTRAGELEFRSTGSTDATKYKLRYHGSRYYFDVFRTADGKYRFYHKNVWHYASYKNNSGCS